MNKRSLVNVSCALDPRSVSPLWCLSAYRSWAALVFVDPGVQINGAYYRDVLLSKQLLPVMREVSGEFFVFQQDNAPAHRHATLCDFSINAGIHSTGSLASEQPVEYRIWSVVQQRVYQSRVHDTDELKQRLQQVWHDVDQSIIDNAIDEWRVFAHACRQTADTSSICCRKQ